MNSAAGNPAWLTSFGGKWVDAFFLQRFLAENDALYGGMLRRLEDRKD